MRARSETFDLCPNILNCVLEPKDMRRMDSAEKRKGRCDDESGLVTEEGYVEDSDPCKSICSGEERWPSSPCVNEDDIFLCMLLSVSLDPKTKWQTSILICKLSSILRTWFQALTAFALRDVESDVE